MFRALLFRQMGQRVSQDLVKLRLAAHGLADEHDAVLNVNHLVQL